MAGDKLYTQVQNLKRRLKELDTSNTKPAEISAVTDALEKLENRLQRKRQEKVERRKTKEKALQEKKQEEMDSLNGKGLDLLKEETPVEPIPTETRTDVIIPGDTTPSIPVATEVTVDAPQTETIEVPMAASTEVESDVNVFALDTIVEPIKGMPGSWGRVMRHDSPDADVYVVWDEGKLKDEHVAGAYSPSDLRSKMNNNDNENSRKVFRYEKEEREEREKQFQRKKKEMGISGKLSKRDVIANLKCIFNDENPAPGTKYLFARSVMAKDGIIIPAGTKAELSQVIGDHFYFNTALGAFIINRFDTPKLVTTAGLKKNALHPMKRIPGGVGNWYEGITSDGYEYQAKVFEGGSQFGINKGPVSKLWITDKSGQTIVNYDRGWDVGEELIELWGPLVDEIEMETQVKSEEVKPHHVDQTQPEMGDMMEDPASGYGGDRPGQWVEPKSSLEQDDQIRNTYNYLLKHYDGDHSRAVGETASELGIDPIQVTKYLVAHEDKRASLKIAQKEWFASRQDNGYLISDELNQKICLIKAENLSKEQLQEIVYNELLKREMLAFTLKKTVGLLKEGHKVTVLETDQKKGQFKFVSKQNNTSGWAPLSALKVEVKTFRSDIKKKQARVAVRPDGYYVVINNVTVAGPFSTGEEAEREDIRRDESRAASKKLTLTKKGKIVKKKDGWHVESEKGKNLGGPYKSREKAQDRLNEVEMFKHMKATRLSKNDPITIKRSILNNMIEKCPNCYKKFVAIAKKGNLKFRIAEDVEISIEDQIKKVKERIQTVKDKFESQDKQATIDEDEAMEPRCVECEHPQSAHHGGICEDCSPADTHQYRKEASKKKAQLQTLLEVKERTSEITDSRDIDLHPQDLEYILKHPEEFNLRPHELDNIQMSVDASQKKADDMGPSDEDTSAKAWEMFKTHWNGLSSEQMDQVYKALETEASQKKAESMSPQDKEYNDLKNQLKTETDPKRRGQIKDRINDLLYEDIERQEKEADHPIEEPAVADIIREIELDFDSLENTYRDNPEVIKHIEDLEDRVNELELKMDVDLPEMAHEREEGHEEGVEKETDLAPKYEKTIREILEGFIDNFKDKFTFSTSKDILDFLSNQMSEGVWGPQIKEEFYTNEEFRNTLETVLLENLMQDEASHEGSVEKETYMEPKPTQPAPQGFKYALDPKTQQWILVLLEQ